jgi:hypothetical protein
MWDISRLVHSGIEGGWSHTQVALVIVVESPRHSVICGMPLKTQIVTELHRQHTSVKVRECDFRPLHTCEFLVCVCVCLALGVLTLGNTSEP